MEAVFYIPVIFQVIYMAYRSFLMADFRYRTALFLQP
jgi:hypothetical protein